jgi:hypothetical protein
MRQSLLQVMCVVVLLCVCWIVVHPAVDVAPSAFRYAVFAALTLFLLRCAFKYARPALVAGLVSSWGVGMLDHPPCAVSTLAFSPLRC